MTRCRLTFRRESSPDQTVSVSVGTRLDAALILSGIPLRTHCGGAGTCGKCQVIVDHRMIHACQTVVESNLDVLIPDSSLQHHEQNIIVQEVFFSSPAHPFSFACSDGANIQFGIALDIGTTTLAAELHEFSGKNPPLSASCINPQRLFGDDVMSRIQKIIEHPPALYTMQRQLVEAVNDLIAVLSQRRGIHAQEISLLSAAGNTVMQSIFWGIDPSPLGASPFQAPLQEFPLRIASELGLNMAIDGKVQAFPIFGGFVGGDIVAGVLALSPLHSSTLPRLLLDIGTNGEIVLAHRGQLFTAAAAAGPAFEGAGIECGTLAVPGAIDHAEFRSGKMTVSTIADKPAVGICGSGLIDIAAILLEQGMILPSGRFADKQSSYEVVSAAESGIGKSIVLTQKDIRELQLASGAIKAAVSLLLQQQNILPEQIETFYISGGFGQSIRIESARQLGLLPPIPSERFQFCGNTSLAGARLLLLNYESADIVQQFRKHSSHYELARHPKFQEVFADSIRWR